MEAATQLVTPNRREFESSGKMSCLGRIRRELDLLVPPSGRKKQPPRYTGYMALITEVIESQSMVGKNRSSDQIPQ